MVNQWTHKWTHKITRSSRSVPERASGSKRSEGASMPKGRHLRHSDYALDVAGLKYEEASR
jgi:hypothetical protein